MAAPGRSVNLERLAEVAMAAETRGRHAFGFAWADGDGRICYFKQAGRIADHLGLLAMAADARVLVGHCRWATHGPASDDRNNHPHLAHGGCYVHNGVVRGHEAIARRRRLRLETECDSEVIGRLIEASRGGVLRRLREATRVCVGGGADARLSGLSCGSGYAVLGVWDEGDGPALYGARAGNPLRTSEVRSGRYLGSLPGGLGKKHGDVRDMTCFRITAGTYEESHV